MEILKKYRSEIRLEEFNSCPGADRLEYALSDIRHRFVDLKTDETYQSWANSGDTAVFIISRHNTFDQMAGLLAEFANLRADEVEVEYLESGNVVVRLWWGLITG